jgi:hypothetical protein
VSSSASPVNSIFVTPTTTLADVGIVRFTVHQAKDLETSGVCAADLKAYAKVFLVIVSCITSSSTESGVCDCFVLCGVDTVHHVSCAASDALMLPLLDLVDYASITVARIPSILP